MNALPKKRKGGVVGERRDYRRMRAAQLHAHGTKILDIALHLGCSVATVRELLAESRPTSATKGTP